MGQNALFRSRYNINVFVEFLHNSVINYFFFLSPTKYRKNMRRELKNIKEISGGCINGRKRAREKFRTRIQRHDSHPASCQIWKNRFSMLVLIYMAQRQNILVRGAIAETKKKAGRVSGKAEERKQIWLYGKTRYGLSCELMGTYHGLLSLEQMCFDN